VVRINSSSVTGWLIANSSFDGPLPVYPFQNDDRGAREFMAGQTPISANG
jgi:hypothetical protein